MLVTTQFMIPLKRELLIKETMMMIIYDETRLHVLFRANYLIELVV